MSKPIPEKSNFIAIGAWNPAIIQPHWLHKYFSDVVPDSCQIEIASIGGATAIRMVYPNVTIDPNNGRLVFIPKELNEEILKYIADLSSGIRTKLEHTPLIAAGSNFVFQLDENEIFTLDEIEQDQQILELYKELKDPGNIVSKTIKHAFSLQNYSINVTYEYVGRDKKLAINFDYQGANPMKRAAEGLVSNYHRALELSGTLIKRK
jgi:hypothetical protein